MGRKLTMRCCKCNKEYSWEGKVDFLKCPLCNSILVPISSSQENSIECFYRLHSACYEASQFGTIFNLLKTNLSDINTRDENNLTPLMAFAYKNKNCLDALEVISLFAANGANVSK